jgi:ERF superfamily
MQTSPEIGKLALALSKAQGEMENADRNKANPFFKTKYAPLDTVIDTIKAALAHNELAYTQDTSSKAAEVSVSTRIMHSSGEWLETTPVTTTARSTATATKGQPDDSPQAVGVCITYLRRYSLMAAVGIAACDEDHDGEEVATHDQAPRPAVASAAVREAEQKKAAEEVARIKAEIKAGLVKARSETDIECWVPSARLLPKVDMRELSPLFLAARERVKALAADPPDAELPKGAA